MNEPEYDENGYLITQRTVKQNSFIRAFNNQFVKWHDKTVHMPIYKKPMSAYQRKYLHEWFHLNMRLYVLIPIFNKQSTTNLSKNQIEEYIASCVVYLAELKIDIYE